MICSQSLDVLASGALLVRRQLEPPFCAHKKLLREFYEPVPELIDLKTNGHANRTNFSRLTISLGTLFLAGLRSKVQTVSIPPSSAAARACLDNYRGTLRVCPRSTLQGLVVSRPTDVLRLVNVTSDSAGGVN